MREEPIISGAVVKAALVLLVAGALGVGAYALVGGDVELPDLPDIDLEELTTPEEGTVGEETSGGETALQEPAALDPFGSASFASALERVRAEAGAGAELTQVTINPVQTQFIVRRGDGVEALSVRAEDGELSREQATVTITGEATIADFAFPLDAVRVASVDRALGRAGKLSGASDFTPTAMTLERAIPFGSRRLQWTLSAEGGGKLLTYRADAAGRQVRDVGGGGTEIPPAARRARKLNQCIEAAGEDTEAVFQCFDRFAGPPA